MARWPLTHATFSSSRFISTFAWFVSPLPPQIINTSELKLFLCRNSARRQRTVCVYTAITEWPRRYVPAIAATSAHTYSTQLHIHRRERAEVVLYVTLLIGKGCPAADHNQKPVQIPNLIELPAPLSNSGRWLRLSTPANYLVPRRACSLGPWTVLWYLLYPRVFEL